MAHANHIRSTVISSARDNAVDTIIDKIKAWAPGFENRFDTIAVSGVSGLGIGSVVAYILKKNLAVVRKSTKDCRSIYKVESSNNLKRYIIVDDLIETGKTIRRIKTTITKDCKANKIPKAKFLTHFLYAG